MTQEHTENTHKNVQGVQREVLYTGKRVQREIQYVRVHHHKTGAFHHDSIALKTYRKSAKTDWSLDEKSSISLSENHDGELTRAMDFVNRCRLGENTQNIDQAITLLSSGPLKQRMAAALQSPSKDLKQALLLLEVAQYRQAVKGLHHLLKQAEQPAARMLAFFKENPELLSQHMNTAYTGPLPPHSLCFQDPLSGHYSLFYLGTYQTQAPLFALNSSCSAWVPTPALNTALGELSYELQALNPLPKPLSINVVLGDIAHDMEQQNALRLYQQRQNYRILSYSQLLKQTTQHLKGLQEHLKQASS